MPQIVEVDGVGEVEFDDGMSLDDIKVAIERDILPMFREQAAASAPEATDISQDFGVLVEDRGGTAVAIVNGRPVPMEQMFPREFSTAFGETAAVGEITPDRLSTAAQRVLADREARARRVDARINPAQFNEPQFRANPAEQAELTRLENAQNEFARSAFSATLQPAQALSKVDEALFEGSQRPELGELAKGRSEMFEGMQQAARETYPTDPRYQGEFLASTLPMTAGSVAPFMLTGAAGGALPSSLLGALMTAQQEYDSAIAAGASEEEARKAGLVGLPIGLTEGLGSIGKGIGSVPGGFKGWLRSIASENMQELSQSGLQTLNASYLSGYDPSRRLSGQEILDTVAATTVISGGMGAPGAIANRNAQPEGVGEIPEEQGPDLAAIAAALYDDEVQETPAPSTPAQEAPPVQAAPPNPIQQASSQLLGQDLTELRQQEAIINGQPTPELEEGVVEEVTTPSGEETVTEEVAEPAAPELVTPEGLTALEPDSFERLMDEPLQEGHRALQDAETFDVFQVPENATPDQIEAARQQARKEGEQLARQYEFEEQRRQRQEDYEYAQRELAALQSVVNRTKPAVQKTIPEPQFRNLWDDPSNLKRVLDQQEQNLKRAQAGTLRDPSGERVTPQQLESGVQALRDRYQELAGKQEAAKTAAKGMRRGNRKEQGSTAIPQAITEFASAIYREGVQFRDWSRQMLKSLGQNIRPFLQDIWNSLTGAVNALSPSQRARVETRMQRRDFSEGGTFGGAGGTRFRQAQEQGRTFTGPEGLPRYEIDDSNMEVVTNLKPGQSAKLGDVIQHDELFDSYPQARDINVEVKTGALGAAYSKAGNKITIYDPLGKGIDNSLFYARALAHEIQHYLQGVEGFAVGGSVREWNRDQIRDEIEFTGDELRSFSESDFESPQEAQEQRQRLNDKLDVLGRAYRAKGGTDYYNRLAGEFEARDVANRLDMTEEERAQTPPYSSEETPQGGLIVNTRPSLMSALEPEQAAPDERPIGIANAQTAAGRERIGLDPRFTPARRTFGTVWDEAMAKIAADPNYPTNLVNELAVDPRDMSDVETATLVYARVLAERSYESSIEAVNNADNEADGIDAYARLQRTKQELDKIYTVAEMAGTETARRLNARKLLVNRDLTLAQMRAETRAIENKGQPLTPEQEQRIDELHAELEAAKKKIAELEEQQAKQQSEKTFKALISEFNKDQKQAKKEGKSALEFLREQAEKARARRKERLGQLNAFGGWGEVADALIIGTYHVASGISKAADFAAKMIEEFGEAIEPHLPEIFKESQKRAKAVQDELNGSSEPSTEGTASVPKVEETPEQVLARATAELDPKLVFDLARAYVRQGMTGEANVMNAVHQALLPLMPELTLREVRDAFSGYGKVKYPSKEDDLTKLREYRRLAQLTSQLEDVQNRIAPLRTGMQRDKMTAEARLLQKQINDLMKKYDLRPTDPLQQLKTSREAVKARLRNEIEELERSIATRTRRAQNRNPIEYDEETKALQERRNKLRERYQEMFPPQAPSVEQRIKQTLNALDKAIAEETQMLKDGVLKRPAKPDSPTSPEIENKRMELDALRQLRRELFAATQPRKSPEDVALEQAIKSAQESIKRMDEMMRTGNIDPKTKAPKFTPTDELENLWMVRDSMRDALNELRKANKPRKDPEETARKKAVKSLTKAIEDLDRRISTGDFSARPKKATRPEVREVAELRARKEALRQALTDMKKAATPARSPEEIKLSRDKKNIRRRIEQLQEKIRNSDYTIAPKPDPVMDKEKLELQRQYQAVRKEYLKGLFEAQLRQRTLAGKLWGSTKEALNTSRSILTSMDFSGVLRQGGFIAFGNPVRAARALPAMFKAFASEKAYDLVMLEIQNRPNAPLYAQAKLYLADTAPASLSQMEEAYMSRWSNRIPGVAGSQRAYVTFLNKLRADSFDAMVAGLAKNSIPTKEESRAVANYVNVATGRGDLGKFAGAGELLNTAFFAPRYVASRFQLLLNPLTGFSITGGSARVREQIAFEYAKFLGGVGAAVALAALAGDDEERGSIAGIPVPIETDPRSSDFLKVRFGNTRLDMLAGLIQTTVVTSRLLTRQIKRASGEIVELTGQDRKISDPSWMDTLGRFMRSKLSPVLGTVFDIGAGENLIGESVTPATALLRGVIPLSVSEIDETMQEQGIPKGVALQLLSLFGVGLQTYEPRESKSSRSSPYSSN